MNRRRIKSEADRRLWIEQKYADRASDEWFAQHNNRIFVRQYENCSWDVWNRRKEYERTR